MPVKFSPTDKQVTSVVDRMLIKHHQGDYCQDGKCLKVDTIFVEAVNGESGDNDANPIVVAGFNRNSKIVIRSLKDRTDGFGDVQIILDRHWWEDANMGERDAEVNTCLLSIEAKRDSEGNFKHDEANRLVVKKRRPDARIDIYDKAVELHGEACQSWKDAKEQIVDKRGQLLFGWQGDIVPPTTAPKELQRAAAASIQGTAKDDTVAKVEKDPDEVRPAIKASETPNPGRKTKRSKAGAANIAQDTAAFNASTRTDGRKPADVWRESQKPPMMAN